MNTPYDTALAVVDEATDLFMGDRAATYGDPLPDFTRIGRMWAAILNSEPIAPHTVAAMLAGLKLIRSQINPAHRDNWVDLVAYGALGADVHQRAHTPEPVARMATQARVQP